MDDRPDDSDAADQRAAYAEYRRKMEADMPPNPNGDPYGCDCDECMDFYRSLKG